MNSPVEGEGQVGGRGRAVGSDAWDLDYGNDFKGRYLYANNQFPI